MDAASLKSFSPPLGNQVPGTVPFWPSITNSRRGGPAANACRGIIASR
jgi:hypothetical protein